MYQLKSIMRSISNILNIPVMVFLILLVIVSLIIIGMFIAEIISERHDLKYSLVEIAEELKDLNIEEIREYLEKKKILNIHKAPLLELINHVSLSEDEIDILGERLYKEVECYYKKRVKITDIISKVGPMFGLLGTLIPLGPGIVALGGGDTITLSQSLLTAFDTTIIGVACALICSTISTIRKGWYEDYLSRVDTMILLLKEKMIGEKNE